MPDLEDSDDGQNPDPKPTPDVRPDPPEVWDQERAMATILKLREQEKAFKKQLKDSADVQARLETLEAEKLSDQEKKDKELAALQAEKASWQQERKETALKLSVLSHSRALGVVDPDIALALLDRSQVEYDKDGEATNVSDLLTALLEAKPLLKGQAPAPVQQPIDGASGRSQGPAPSLTAAELEAAKETGLQPDRFEALKGVSNINDWEQLQRSAAQQ